MEYTLVIIAAAVMSLAGFIMLFYAKYAQTKINHIDHEMAISGIDIFSHGNLNYYSVKFEKWRTNEFFNSPLAAAMGVFLVFIASILTFFSNGLLSMLFVLTTSYFMHKLMVRNAGWKSQKVSFLLFIVSLVILIFSFEIYL
jgi:hypothetical protein